MIGTSSTLAGRIWKFSSVFTSRLTVHDEGTDATGAAVRAFGMWKPGIHEIILIHRFPPSRFTNSESAKREFGKRNLRKREKAGATAGRAVSPGILVCLICAICGHLRLWFHHLGSSAASPQIEQKNSHHLRPPLSPPARG